MAQALEGGMDDVIYLGILAGCLVATLGLVRLCAVIMPGASRTGGKP
jgi:hypothetical protein